MMLYQNTATAFPTTEAVAMNTTTAFPTTEAPSSESLPPGMYKATHEQA